MFEVRDYLRAEIGRYFPNAESIDIDVGDEVYDVYVRLTERADLLHYHMDVGSDDNCFAFTNEYTGATITVPFAPEMGADEDPGMTWQDLMSHVSRMTRDHHQIAEWDKPMRLTDDNDPHAPWFKVVGIKSDDDGKFFAIEEIQR